MGHTPIEWSRDVSTVTAKVRALCSILRQGGKTVATVEKFERADPEGKTLYRLTCSHGTTELWATPERVELLGDGNVIYELADDHSGLVDCGCGEATKKQWVRIPDTLEARRPIEGVWEDGDMTKTAMHDA
jgi:hypothetical protein